MSPIRVRPAPPLDGPEDPDRAPRVRGSLALALPVRQQPVPVRLVPPATRREPPGPPPPLHPWAGRLCQAIAEVLSGSRGPAQLVDHADFIVLCYLERWAGRLRDRGRVSPAPRVSSVRVCQPTPAVAEVSAVIDTGGRRRAMAMRLEATGARWRATVLQIG